MKTTEGLTRLASEAEEKFRLARTEEERDYWGLMSRVYTEAAYDTEMEAAYAKEVKEKTKEKFRFPFAVYRTAFHGGGLVSQHKTRAAAEKAATRLRMSDCCCGCSGVINLAAGERPGTDADQNMYPNPYAVGKV